MLSILMFAAILSVSDDVVTKNHPLIPDEVIEVTSESTNLLLQQFYVNPSDQITIQLIRAYLLQAKNPGFSEMFHYAENIMNRISKKNANTPEVLLLHADIAQHKHEFQTALNYLGQIYTTEPNHPAASLMAARIYLTLDRPELAQKACNRLFLQDIFLFSVCSYEVLGRRGQWQEAYQQLQSLFVRHQQLDFAIELWVRAILAEQAEQLGLLEQALNWLNVDMQHAPTSHWLKWADLNLSLSQAATVYQKLGQLANSILLEDALMLRLAKAENVLGYSTQYQTIAHNRMQIRVIRNDQEHAADLAYYFLKLQLDPEAAFHWATINYASAKEPDDRALLEISKALLTTQD